MPRVYPWNRKGKKQKRQPRGTTSIALSRNKEFLDRAREHLLAKGEVFISAKHNLYGSRTLSYCYKIKHQVGDSSSDDDGDDDSDSGKSNASTIPSGYFELVIFTKLYTKSELGNYTETNVHNGFERGHWSFSIGAKFGRVGIISDLHTRSEMKGKGITKPLFLSVQADMEEAGFTTLEAFSPSNEGLRFYSSCCWWKHRQWPDFKYIFNASAYKRRNNLGNNFDTNVFNDTKGNFCKRVDNIIEFTTYTIYNTTSLTALMQHEYSTQLKEMRNKLAAQNHTMKQNIRMVRNNTPEYNTQERKLERLIRRNKTLTTRVAELEKKGKRPLETRYEDLMRDADLMKKVLYKVLRCEKEAIQNHVQTKEFRARSFSAIKKSGIGNQTLRNLRSAQMNTGAKHRRRSGNYKIPCKWGRETFMIPNTATILASTPKDLAEILKVFIDEKLIPQIKQLPAIKTAHACVSIYEAIKCFMNALEGDHMDGYGQLNDRLRLAIAVLKDGAPQSKTGLSRDLIVVSIEILNKRNGNVWEKIVIGIFDAKESTEEEKAIDAWLKEELYVLEQKIEAGELKIPGSNEAYDSLDIICRMDLKAVQSTCGGSSFTSKKRMFIQIAGKNPTQFGALGTVGRSSGHQDGGLYYNFKCGSYKDYLEKKCDYYFLDRKLWEFHHYKMKGMDKEEREKYCMDNEIAIVRDGIMFTFITTDSLHYMTGVSKEIIELFIHFTHRVDIRNGFRNDTEFLR